MPHPMWDVRKRGALTPQHPLPPLVDPMQLSHTTILGNLDDFVTHPYTSLLPLHATSGSSSCNTHLHVHACSHISLAFTAPMIKSAPMHAISADRAFTD